MKPGFKTSELYVTLATFALGAVTLVHPGFKTPPGLAQALATAAPGVAATAYTLGRSLLKATASKAVGSSPTVVVNAPAAAEPAEPVTAEGIAREIVKLLSPPPPPAA